jgi:hypothetical protein
MPKVSLDTIAPGYCQCGCGRQTAIIAKTDRAEGRIKGQPNAFIKGHHARLYPKPVDYIEDDNGCWVWQRHIMAVEGYGRLRIDGRFVMAHRYYYEKHVGPIPDGLVIDHLCRNRACVNPAHLEPVSLRENILRGEGIGARYARRTHCENGHPYEGDNLYVAPNGSRRCRICRRDAR